MYISVFEHLYSLDLSDLKYCDNPIDISPLEDKIK